MPALFTQASIRPYVSTPARASASTCSRSETSHGKVRHSPPRDRQSTAVSSSSAARRAASTRRAPFPARASAVSRPIPLEAPVTTTTAPSSRILPPRFWGKSTAGRLRRQLRGSLPVEYASHLATVEAAPRTDAWLHEGQGGHGGDSRGAADR